MSERICGLCGGEAAGFASVWTAKTGDVPYCHGDDDAESTCYERAQQRFIRDYAVPMSVAVDWPPTEDVRAALDTLTAEGIPETFEVDIIQREDREYATDVPYKDRAVEYLFRVEASRAAKTGLA